MNNTLDLAEILMVADDAERKRLLIRRGWQLQREEVTNDKERELCDWFLTRAEQ